MKSKNGFSMIAYIIISCVILRIIVSIFDFINVFCVLLNIELKIGGINLLFVLFRYVPVALTTIFIMLLIVKLFVKDNHKKDIEDIRKQLLTGSIIVAIIIFVYGMYSLMVNYKKINDIYDKYESMYSAEVEEYKGQLNDNIPHSIFSWFMTSAVYFASAMLMRKMATNKMNKWLKDDEPEMIEEEPQDEQQQQFENDETIVNNTNNIKWDL